MNNLKYNVKKLGIVVQEFVVSEGGTKIVEKVYNCPDNVLQDKNVRAKALCVKRQTPILLASAGAIADMVKKSQSRAN